MTSDYSALTLAALTLAGCEHSSGCPILRSFESYSPSR